MAPTFSPATTSEAMSGAPSNSGGSAARTSTAPASSRRFQAASTTDSTCASRPSRNWVGMPMRAPASVRATTGESSSATQASKSARSATRRAMGPTWSKRSRVSGITPAFE
jgi:hypothetical protein